jgi:hypothetical protein
MAGKKKAKCAPKKEAKKSPKGSTKLDEPKPMMAPPEAK